MEDKKAMKKDDFKNLSLIMYFLKPQIIAYLITAIVFIGVAIILTYTNFDESKIPFVSLICTSISSFIAGFDTAGNFGKRGFLFGAVAGIIYSVILFIIFIFANGNLEFNMGKVTTIIISVASGIIGGVLGVNTKIKK